MPAERDTASPRWPLAFAVVNPGPDERVVAIHDMLVIGRECPGIDEAHQLIIEDDTVSRRHAEIRLDPDSDRAYVFDTSTNGTRLNGTRVESATNVLLKPGDRLTIGNAQVEFRADRFEGLALPHEDDVRLTTRAVSMSRLAMAAGDLIGYEAITQYTEEDALLKSIDQLYGELSALLVRHGGSLNSYVADAFFATWGVDDDPAAVTRALTFALDATELVASLAPTLALRTPDDEPVRMGWGVAVGTAALSALAGSRLAILGDATNVAFQLATVAGRDGRDTVVVSGRVEEALREQFEFGAPEELMVKGRLGAERIFGARRPR